MDLLYLNHCGADGILTIGGGVCMLGEVVMPSCMGLPMLLPMLLLLKEGNGKAGGGDVNV